MHERSMQWYGEYLWRGMIDKPPAGDFSYEVCATDAAGNRQPASNDEAWNLGGYGVNLAQRVPVAVS
jgi:hypothetical protein